MAAVLENSYPDKRTILQHILEQRSEHVFVYLVTSVGGAVPWPAP